MVNYSRKLEANNVDVDYCVNCLIVLLFCYIIKHSLMSY